MPKAKYLENSFLESNAIFIPRYKIIKNNDTTITTPKNPNSSDIIEKIKSVCGSGK